MLKKNNKQLTEEYDIMKQVVGLRDLAVPDCFVEEKDYLYFGYKKYARVCSIIYPRIMEVGFLNEYFNLGNIEISTYIENIPDSQVIRSLTNEITVKKSNMRLQVNRGNEPDYGEVEAINDLSTLRESVQTNKDRLSLSQTLITLWGSTLEDLDEKTGMFQDMSARKGIRVRVLALDQQKAFISTLPNMNIKYNTDMRNATTGNIACLIPTGNTQFSHSSGILLGRNAFTKSPIFFDNFIGPPHLTNPHIGIYGMPGAGKSVTMKTNLGRSCAAGEWGIVLDPEEEYKEFIKQLGGQYIVLKAGEKAGINPFELEIEEDDNGKKYIDIHAKCADLREMINMFCEKFRGQSLQGQEITVLEEVVRKLYAEREITEEPNSLFTEENEQVNGKFLVGKVKKRLPQLSDMVEELNKIEWTRELAALLRILTGNNSLAMFDCQTTIQLEKRAIGISFKHLNDEFTKFFATVNTLSWIWSKLSNWNIKTIHKKVFCDETWIFARYKHSVSYLEQIERRGRKYKIALYTGSQMINEFLSSDSGRAIISLASTKFIMLQDSTVAKQVAEFFGLSRKCEQLISTFPPGYGILKTEKDLAVVQVKIFDFEAPYVTT